MKGFKTVAFGLLLALTSIFSSPEMATYFSENLPFVGTATGAIVVVLRGLTNSSIFKAEPPAKPEA